jgi:hypothetical protein
VEDLSYRVMQGDTASHGIFERILHTFPLLQVDKGVLGGEPAFSVYKLRLADRHVLSSRAQLLESQT